MATPTEAREAVLKRYRRLRQINKDHHSKASQLIPKKRLLDWGKRLGLVARGRVFVAACMEELLLAHDLALYSARAGEIPVIERYRRTSGAPEGSEERIVLDAMCDTRFAFLHIAGRHPVAGLVARDILLDEDLWLMDELLEQTAQPGLALATRLFRPDGFLMTTGTGVPIDEPLLAEVDRAFPLRELGQNSFRGSNARLIQCVYRTAIAHRTVERLAFG